MRQKIATVKTSSVDIGIYLEAAHVRGDVSRKMRETGLMFHLAQRQAGGGHCKVRVDSCGKLMVAIRCGNSISGMLAL